MISSRKYIVQSSKERKERENALYILISKLLEKTYIDIEKKNVNINSTENWGVKYKIQEFFNKTKWIFKFKYFI